MFRVMEETSNLDQIIFLIKNFIPNMIELFKLLKNQIFFLRLAYFVKEIEQRELNIMELCKPQENDDFKILSNYFEEFVDLIFHERILPINIGKEFYFAYSELFRNKNLDKIELIHEMLKTYNIHLAGKYKIRIEGELENSYHETGMNLINKQILLNMDAFQFLKKDSYFKDKKNEIPIKIIYKGIIFKEDDTKFISDFLNDSLEDFKLKEFFRKDY